MEKPQPNYKRDGIFIVSLILIVMILEVATGTDDSVSMQTIPKPKAPQASDQYLKFALPDGWKAGSNSSPMTTHSFDATGGAFVTVIPLPAAVAGTTDIVNLWRQQVGLGEIGPEEAAKAAKAITISGQPGSLYDFTGETPV
ncbi:MAG: hypothetical protein ACPHJZ_03875, partial [Limisphaerales bacterium]